MGCQTNAEKKKEEYLHYKNFFCYILYFFASLNLCIEEKVMMPSINNLHQKEVCKHTQIRKIFICYLYTLNYNQFLSFIIEEIFKIAPCFSKEMNDLSNA